MNPELTIENHIMNPKRMDELMIKDRSVVPPDSVIKTFAHLKGDQIHLALSQDKDGLAPSSFVVRNGDWAKFFLETWFDPLYRSYNFQKAETHALVRSPLTCRDYGRSLISLRNISSSGTQPSSQRWPSSPNAS
jgi:mannan polymerase II complex MNN11 subunit